VNKLGRRILSAAAFAASASWVGCAGQVSDVVEPDAEPSLTTLAGTCAVEKFEIWSAPPAPQLLYDAAASGYVGTLRITATSRLAGSYTFSATSHDPLSLGQVASGTLTLVEPDTLRFSGASSLPGVTLFTLAGTLLTLVNPSPRGVTLTPGATYSATIRIECRQ